MKPGRSPSRVRLSQAEAEAYLLGFINYETVSRYKPTTRTHDLLRFKSELIRKGWHPGAIPTVHVGGTNGKGSVSVLLERVLRAGGLRTGLYTSPHVISMRERIRLDGRPLSSPAFRDGVGRLAPVLARDEGFRTTFEHLTALGFLAFQEADVDVAVIEVGLGGRLDATNILPPGRAVLTPISLDHRQILGKTVGAIAADKAHILKRGGQAFLMPQRPVARDILLERCRRESLVPLWTSDRVHVELGINPSGVVLHVLEPATHGPIQTRLLGGHQAANIAAVVAVAETFFSGDLLSVAIKRGLSEARVPGRLDLRETSHGRVVFDGGHNPGAARAVAEAIGEHFPGARVHAVIGMARDKDARGYLNALTPYVSAFHFTTTHSPRAASPETLKGRSPRGGTVHTAPGGALEKALTGRPDLVLVGGSFLLVGEIMRALDLRL